MLLQEFKNLKSINDLQFECKFNEALKEIELFVKRKNIAIDEQIAGLILKTIILRKLGYMTKAEKNIDKTINEVKNTKNQLLLDCLLEKGMILWEQAKDDKLLEVINDIEALCNSFDKRKKRDLLYYKAKLTDLKSYFNNTLRNYDQAVHNAKEALKLKKQLKIDQEIVNTLIICGMVHSEKFDCEIAINYFEQALKLAKKINDMDAIFNIYDYIGYTYFRKVDYKQSREYFEQNIEFSKNFESEYYRFKTIFGMGFTYGDTGDTERHFRTFYEIL